MPIAKCVFCGINQEDYKGIYLIKNDGTTNYYSSSKCMKNHLRLKRDRRKIRWTEAFSQQKAQRKEQAHQIEEQRKIRKAQKQAKKLAKRK